MARLQADPIQAAKVAALESQPATAGCQALKQAIRAGLVDPSSQSVRDLVTVALDRAELDASGQLERARDRAALGLRDLAGTYRQAARESAQESRQASDRAAGALGAAEALRAALKAATGAEL